MEPQTISFIVLNRNNPESVVRKVIESIKAIDYPAKEIILIDDASTIRLSPKLVSAVDSFSQNKKRRGIGFSRMIGLRKAKGDLVAIVDADIVIDSFPATELIQSFQARPKLAAICGRYKSIGRNNWNDALDLRRKWFYGKGGTAFFDQRSPHRATFSGGFCLLNRHRINSAKQRYHIASGGEDILFQANLLSSGYLFGYLPSFSGTHLHHRGIKAALQKAVSDARGGINVPFMAISRSIPPPMMECFTGFPVFLVLACCIHKYFLFLLCLEFFPLFVVMVIERSGASIRLFLYETIASAGRVYYGVAYLPKSFYRFDIFFRCLFFIAVSGVAAKYNWLKTSGILLFSRALYETSYFSKTRTDQVSG